MRLTGVDPGKPGGGHSVFAYYGEWEGRPLIVRMDQRRGDSIRWRPRRRPVVRSVFMLAFVLVLLLVVTVLGV